MLETGQPSHPSVYGIRRLTNLSEGFSLATKKSNYFLSWLRNSTIYTEKDLKIFANASGWSQGYNKAWRDTEWAWAASQLIHSEAASFERHALLQLLGRRCILVCDWQSRKWYGHAKEKIRIFSAISSDQPHLFANGSSHLLQSRAHYRHSYWNTFGEPHKLSPSYALHYTGDHVLALALPGDLEEIVHIQITIQFLKKKNPKKNLTTTPNKAPATCSHP